MVQFIFQGKLHRLEFERKKTTVTVHKQGKPQQIPSKYPFTTVRLLQLAQGATPIKVTQATVGCAPTDQYTNERGRLESLKLLSKNLDRLFTKTVAKELRTAIWDAYTSRRLTKEAPEVVH